MPDPTPPIVNQIEPVVLIHGTFAYHDSNEATGQDETRWWLRGSAFCRGMTERLQQSVPAGAPDSGAPESNAARRIIEFAPLGEEHYEEIAPAKRPLFRLLKWWLLRGEPPEPAQTDARPEAVFHWSGENSEHVRRIAGIRLLGHLRRMDGWCERNETGFHVIAHSHGGAVLWEALCESLREERPLNCLRSWMTVATPFLLFKPNWRTFWITVLALVIVTSIGVYEGTWFNDFWRQILPESAYSPCRTFLTVVHLYAVIILLPCMLLRVAWARYCRSVDSVSQSRDRKQIETADVASSLLAFCAATILLLPWLPFYDRDHLVASARLGLRFEVICATLWAVAIGAAGLWLIVFLVLFLVRTYDNLRRRSLRVPTFIRYGSLYGPVALGAAHMDEAINGLRAIRTVPQGPLLPTIPAPRSGQLSRSAGRLRYPEREGARHDLWRWVFAYLLLPAGFVYDWIARPLYNDVFAPLVDEFVLTRLTRSAHGADIPGLVLGDVICHPLTSEERTSVSHQLETPWQKVEKDLNLQRSLGKSTQRYAKRFLQRVRTVLGFDYKEGIELLQFFKMAMGGEGRQRERRKEKTDPSNLLIHTSYFGDKLVQEAIAACFGAPAQGLPFVDLSEHTRPTGPRSWPTIGGIASYVLQGLVKSVVFLSPFLVLAGLGYVVLYPYSRQFHVNWAQEFATNPDAFETTFARTPAAVDTIGYQRHLNLIRWYALRSLLSPTESIAQGIQQEAERPAANAAFFAYLSKALQELELPAQSEEASQISLRYYRKQDEKEIDPGAKSILIGQGLMEPPDHPSKQAKIVTVGQEEEIPFKDPTEMAKELSAAIQQSRSPTELMALSKLLRASYRLYGTSDDMARVAVSPRAMAIADLKVDEQLRIEVLLYVGQLYYRIPKGRAQGLKCLDTARQMALISIREDRSVFLGRVAAAYARIGQYREARRLADIVGRGDDRAPVMITILIDEVASRHSERSQAAYRFDPFTDKKLTFEGRMAGQ